MINREMRLNEGASSEKLGWKIEKILEGRLKKIFKILGVSKASIIEVQLDPKTLAFGSRDV